MTSGVLPASSVVGYSRTRNSLTFTAVAEVAGPSHVELLDAASVLEGAPAEPPLPPRTYFATARALAEDAASRMETLAPGFFDDVLPESSLREPYVAGLTLRLTLKELPGLLAFFRSRTDGRPQVLCDSPLSAVQLRDVRRLTGLPDAPLRTTTTLGADVLDRLGGSRAGSAIRRRARAMTLRSAEGVVVCGTGTDVPLARALADVMRRRRLVVALAKNDRPETQRALGKIEGRLRVVTREQMDQLPWRRSTRRRYARKVANLQDAVGHLESEERVFALHHLTRMLALARQAASLERFLAEVRPSLVLGALDRSPFGALMRSCASRPRPTIVNVQHGTFLPLGVMDLLDFDLVLAWNDASASAYADDGSTGATRIIGNPHWDRLRSEHERASAHFAVRELRRWTGDGHLVVAFPQPERGPLLSPAALRRFNACLLELGNRREDVRILVKQRARAQEDPSLQLLDPLVAAGRARVVPATELELSQALAAADLAVSMYSTALADAAAVGVNGAAFDPDDTVRDLGLDFTPLVHFCRDSGQVSRALDAGPRSVTPERRADLLPSFGVSYGQRLSNVLSEAMQTR